MKRDAIEEKFRTDPASKCSHEEREIRRRLIQEYDTEILNMLASDQAAIESLLSSTPSR